MAPRRALPGVETEAVHTISVKVMDEIEPSAALDMLRNACEQLMTVTDRRAPVVEPLFPESRDPEIMSMYTVEVHGDLERATSIADAIAGVAGVEYAEREPARYPV